MGTMSVASAECDYVGCEDAHPSPNVGARPASPVQLKGHQRDRSLPTSIKMNDPALESRGRGLRAIGDAELTEKRVDMRFDGRLRNRQLGRDLFITTPFDNQFEHLQFAPGQFLPGHSFGEAFRHRRRDTPRSRVNGTNRVEQIIKRDAFQQIPLGAGF